MTFSLKYFLLFSILFITEIIIVTFLKQGFIRHIFGDYLVVMLIYCFIKSFISSKPIYVATFTLAIAFIIEFFQLIDILSVLNIEKNTFTKLVLGTTFQIEDLIAYTLGIVTVILIEKKFNHSS